MVGIQRLNQYGDAVFLKNRLCRLQRINDALMLKIKARARVLPYLRGQGLCTELLCRLTALTQAVKRSLTV